MPSRRIKPYNATQNLEIESEAKHAIVLSNPHA